VIATVAPSTRLVSASSMTARASSTTVGHSTTRRIVIEDQKLGVRHVARPAFQHV